jgi:hypothetical protein
MSWTPSLDWVVAEFHREWAEQFPGTDPPADLLQEQVQATMDALQAQAEEEMQWQRGSDDEEKDDGDRDWQFLQWPEGEFEFAWRDRLSDRWLVGRGTRAASDNWWMAQHGTVRLEAYDFPDATMVRPMDDPLVEPADTVDERAFLWFLHWINGLHQMHPVELARAQRVFLLANVGTFVRLLDPYTPEELEELGEYSLRGKAAVDDVPRAERTVEVVHHNRAGGRITLRDAEAQRDIELHYVNLHRNECDRIRVL